MIYINWFKSKAWFFLNQYILTFKKRLIWKNLDKETKTSSNNHDFKKSYILNQYTVLESKKMEIDIDKCFSLFLGFLNSQK